MTQTTATATAAWKPADAMNLIIDPVAHESLAAQLGTYQRTTASKLRAPRVTQFPTTSWVDEGEEIDVSQATLDELEVTFSKVAGLTPISYEMLNDSGPQIDTQIGNGLARDISIKIDEAFFGTNAEEPRAPTGLLDIEGVTGIDAPAEYTDLDVFNAGRFAAASHGARITAWAANPADAEELAALKESSSSARTLLTSAPDQIAALNIDGVPLFTSPAVKAGTIWGIPKDRVIIGVNEDVRVDSSKDAMFTSDRVVIRAIMRIGFGFTHPEAIVKISKPTENEDDKTTD